MKCKLEQVNRVTFGGEKKKKKAQTKISDGLYQP